MNVLARLFFMAIPAFFVFWVLYLLCGANDGSLFIAALAAAGVLNVGFEATTPRKDRGEF
jgi:hypothetical protein